VKLNLRESNFPKVVKFIKTFLFSQKMPCNEWPLAKRTRVPKLPQSRSKSKIYKTEPTLRSQKVLFELKLMLIGKKADGSAAGTTNSIDPLSRSNKRTISHNNSMKYFEHKDTNHNIGL
jgi:hypothetical protein